jgi:hypothetical protein
MRWDPDWDWRRGMTAARRKFGKDWPCVLFVTVALACMFGAVLLGTLSSMGNSLPAIAGTLATSAVFLLLALFRMAFSSIFGTSPPFFRDRTGEPHDLAFDGRPVTQAAIDKIGVVCTNAQLPNVLVPKVPEACWALCCVCLHPIRPHATVRGLSCGHAFHKKCIDDWFRIAIAAEHLRCPLCRVSALVRPDLRIEPSKQSAWRSFLTRTLGDTAASAPAERSAWPAIRRSISARFSRDLRSGEPEAERPSAPSDSTSPGSPPSAPAVRVARSVGALTGNVIHV